MKQYRLSPSTGIIFFIIITSFIFLSNRISKLPSAKFSPLPSPSQDADIPFRDQFTLEDILSQNDLVWLYADQTKQCLYGSRHYRGDENDSLWGWYRRDNDLYEAVPICAGECPSFFIKKVHSVRWDNKDNLCRIGMMMDLQINNNPPKLIWDITDYYDWGNDGQQFDNPPSEWNSMIEGIKLK